MARATDSQHSVARRDGFGFAVLFRLFYPQPVQRQWAPPARFTYDNIRRGLVTVNQLRLILTIIRLEGPQTTAGLRTRLSQYMVVTEPLLGRLLRILKAASAIDCVRRVRNEAAWWSLPGQELPEEQPRAAARAIVRHRSEQPKSAGSWWAGAGQAAFTETARRRWRDS